MKKLIEESIDIDAKGKSIESLQASRKKRNDFLHRYGYIPTSILKHNLSDSKMNAESCNLTKNERSNTYVQNKNKNKLSKDIQHIKSFSVSSSGVRFGALSGFPQTIGRLIIDFYCPENATVYDPFAGHNSRMELVFRSDRNYIGIDVSSEFMKWNRSIRDSLLNEKGFISSSNTIDLLEQSSSKVDSIANESADFTITSPPYWDIEYYGDEEEQLGKCKTYESFLSQLSLHIKENFRILKSKSYCCWFVNDFRKNNKFYPYHCDVYNLLQNAGFIAFNIYIVDLKSAIGSCFLQKIIDTKIFPKQHEYCLIFIKP